VHEELLELLDGLVVLAEDRIGAAQLPARVAVVGGGAQPLLELRWATCIFGSSSSARVNSWMASGTRPFW